MAGTLHINSYQMNILITSTNASIAGSTYSTAYLARGLSNRGHQVFLACPEHSLLKDLVKDAAVHHIPLHFKGKIDRSAIKKLAQVVRDHHIDIINAQSSKDRYATILARWWFHLPVKLVHTRRQLSKSAGILGQSWFYEKGTDRIVAVSQGVKDSLTAIGISAQHIKVIHNGTPADKYTHIDPHKTAALRRQYAIEPEDIVIGSVSRLKEQRQILKALSFVNQPVKVIFVGIEPQPLFEPLVRSYKQQHQVYYTGEVNNQEALHYYTLFTMNILATTIEGLSQSLLEAMALKVPVIATAIGGNPELIQDGQNGLLFENDDIATLARHINRLIGDPALRHQLATHAQKTALTDFSIEKTVANYEHFFKNLVGQDSPSHSV